MEFVTPTSTLDQEKDSWQDVFSFETTAAIPEIEGSIKNLKQTIYISAQRSTKGFGGGTVVSDFSEVSLFNVPPRFFNYARYRRVVLGFSDLAVVARGYEDLTNRNTEFSLRSSEPKTHKNPFELSTKVQHFCSSQGLDVYLQKLFDLVQSCFVEIENYLFRIQEDPDIPNEKWLVLELSLTGEVEQISKSYDQYILGVTSLLPENQRGKFSLAFNID